MGEDIGVAERGEREGVRGISFEPGVHIAGLGEQDVIYRAIKAELDGGNPFAHVWMRPDQIAHLPWWMPKETIENFRSNERMVDRIKERVRGEEGREVVFVPDSLPARGADGRWVWLSIPVAPREVDRKRVMVLGTDISFYEGGMGEVNEQLAVEAEKKVGRAANRESMLHESGQTMVLGAAAVVETALVGGMVLAAEGLRWPRNVTRRTFLKLSALAAGAVTWLWLGGEAAAPRIAGARAKVAKTLKEKDYWLEVASKKEGFFKTEWVNGRTALWVAKAQHYLSETGMQAVTVIPCGEAHVREAKDLERDAVQRQEMIGSLAKWTVGTIGEAGKVVGLTQPEMDRAWEVGRSLLAGYTIYEVEDAGERKLPEDFFEEGKYIRNRGEMVVEEVAGIYDAQFKKA